MRLQLGLLAATAAVALAGAAQAQVATNITADTGALGLGTTVVRSGAVLSIDGGRRAGPNLFHSFNQFSLGQGETAQWVRAAGGAASIDNVINRVTGGKVSEISGKLDSTAFPNAAFFFINPAGIVFGPGAQVNVPSAAHFSTAGELRFADGTRFATTTPSGSTFSMAAPASFGFVGGQSDVAVIGGGLTAPFAPANVALSLTGANVLIDSSDLKLRGLDAVAVGKGASVASIANPLSGTVGGKAVVSDSLIYLTPAGGRTGGLRLGGGDVIVAGSFITVESKALAATGVSVFSDGLGLKDSKLTSLATGQAAGADISLDVFDLVLDSSTIASETRAAGRGGLIVVDAATVTFDGVAGLDTTTEGPGRGGDIAILTSSLDINDGFLITETHGQGKGGDVVAQADLANLISARISSSASRAGAGGNVSIKASELTATDVEMIASNTGNGVGGSLTLSGGLLDLVETTISTSGEISQPGDILVQGGRITISGGFIGSAPGDKTDSGAVAIVGEESVELFGAQLNTNSYSDGAAGSIIVTAPEIFVADGTINADTFGNGNGGLIVFQGRSVYLLDTVITADALGETTKDLGLVLLDADEDLTIETSSIASNAYSSADGGVISITGKDVLLLDSEIEAGTIGAGDAGAVSISGSNSLQISNGSVSSDSSGDGKAGGVVIQGGAIKIDVSAAISSDSLYRGDAGGVFILGKDVTLEDGAAITSRALTGFGGDAGTISVIADKLTVTDAIISSDTNTEGQAGQIVLDVGELTLSGNGVTTYITSDTTFRGDAGGVSIKAKTLTVSDGAYISSNTFDDGNSGSVDVKVTGKLSITNGSYIASDSYGFGHAGDVSVAAGTLLIESGDNGQITYISSDSLDGGDAGTVFVQADTLTLNLGGFISSDTYSSGNAGDVTIRAKALNLTSNGRISSTARAGSFGEAGSILVTTGSLTLVDGAISSDALINAEGDAGTVTVKADAIRVGAGSQISSNTNGFGDAGDVTIVAKSLTVEADGVVSSESQVKAAGDAGIVDVTADELTVRGSGQISTSTRGVGDAGLVFVEAGRIVVDGEGEISSAARPGATGMSGSLFITADRVSLTNGGAITTLSNNRNKAGEIDLEAGSLDIDGEGSALASENRGGGVLAGGTGGDAGSILVVSDGIRVANGGRISTNANQGAAGEIALLLSDTARLTLEGADAPGNIQTSSGQDTGGKITIASPYAIISNGGRILALGERNGANVVIQSQFFINSFDRLNRVAVDGEFALDAGLDDVSSGTVSRDLSVLDASKVLRGQCPVARATGQVSQLTLRQTGPYAPEAAPPLMGSPPRAPASPPRVSLLGLGGVIAGACH